MFKKAIKRNIIIFSVFLMAFLFGGNISAYSFSESGIDTTVGEISKGGYDYSKSADASTFIGQIIGVALSLLGVIFLILMIYGGFLWMTARGDGGQIDKAKGLMTAAIIGLIIVLSAYAITYFVMIKVHIGAQNTL